MNILIVDDYEMISIGILSRIEKAMPEATAHYVSNFRDAVATLHTKKIDLMLCDLEFKNEAERDGFSFISEVREKYPGTKTIALTHYKSYAIMKQALNAGAHSFLFKGCSFEDFSETLMGVMEKDYFESETMKLLKRKRYDLTEPEFADSLHGISSLSAREIELLLCSKKTVDRNVLARQMNISPYTVDSYFKAILQKLNLKSRKEAALFAREFENQIRRWKK